MDFLLRLGDWTEATELLSRRRCQQRGRRCSTAISQPDANHAGTKANYSLEEDNGGPGRPQEAVQEAEQRTPSSEFCQRKPPRASLPVLTGEPQAGDAAQTAFSTYRAWTDQQQGNGRQLSTAARADTSLAWRKSSTVPDLESCRNSGRAAMRASTHRAVSPGRSQLQRTMPGAAALLRGPDGCGDAGRPVSISVPERSRAASWRSAAPAARDGPQLRP